MDWLVLIIVSSIIISPLIFLPCRLLDGFILPQIGATAIGVSIALVLMAYLGVISYNFTSILIILYLIYLLLNSTWSTVPHNTLRDIPLVVGYLGMFLVCSILFTTKINITAISLAVFFTACFTSLYGIGQRFLFEPFFPERLEREWARGRKDKKGIPRDNRAVSSLGNTTFFAGYLSTTLPFLVYLTIEVSSWFVLSIILVVIAIITTRSRAGILGIVCFILGLLIVTSKNGQLLNWCISNMNLSNWLSFEYGITLLVLGSYIGIGYGFKIAYRIARHPTVKTLSDKTCRFNTHLDIEDNKDTFYAQLRFRLRYWKIAWDLIKQKPLHGFGLKAYRKEVYNSQSILNAKDNKFLAAPYATPQPRECHNDFIEAFVEGGIIGGGLLLTIIGVVIYNAIIADTFLTTAILLSLLAAIVNIFFFFPLRLGPSSVLFFTSLCMLESLSGQLQITHFQSNFIIVLFVGGMLVAMLWEGVIKPNLGNWYFTKSNFATNAIEKEKMMLKAIKYCPYETIFRTHAMIGYMEAFPYEAEKHAEIMKYYYDGMTPAWIMMFNYGICKKQLHQWQQAEQAYQEAIRLYPLFTPSQNELNMIWPLAPLPKQGPIIPKPCDEAVNVLKKCRTFIEAKLEVIKQKEEEMKRISPEGIEAINRCKAETQHLQSEVNNQNLVMLNIVLSEKLKLNIPFDWAFDTGNGVFLSPRQVGEGNYEVQNTGHPGVVFVRPKQ